MAGTEEETKTDAKWCIGKPSNSSTATRPNNNGRDEPDQSLPPRVKFIKYDFYYDMTGDKYLIIFNHRTYEKTRYFGFKTPLERNHTEKDVKSLNDTFKNIGFKTIVHNDLTHVGILDKMAEGNFDEKLFMRI